MARPRRHTEYRSRLAAKKLGNSLPNWHTFADSERCLIGDCAFRIGSYEIGTPKYPNSNFVGSVWGGEQTAWPHPKGFRHEDWRSTRDQEP